MVTLKSPQTRIEPSCFGTGTMGAAHSLQFSLITMPASSRRSSSFPTHSLIAKGTGLGLQNFGLAPSFKCKCDPICEIQHNGAFLEIHIFVSLYSRYLKHCSVVISSLYCKGIHSYKARQREKQYTNFVCIPTAIKITHI